jgi:predicted HD superfamily hydrolase involved in NAD metabolism
MNYTDKELSLNKNQKKILDSLKSKIKSIAGKDLFNHMEGTLFFAEKLAKKHLKRNLEKYPVSEDLNIRINELYLKLCIACVLHDYGKIFRFEELVRIAKVKRLGLSEFEINCRPIIHSFVTPFLVSRDFNINDETISCAIRSHTIGSTDMNIIDRILYIADKVEPSRNYTGSQRLRKISIKDIDFGLLEVYKSNIIYIITNSNTLHPETGNIWNYILGGLKNAT